MRLRSVTIQGFRSFAEEQSLDLAALPPGLYHVQGRNLLEPELEANGAGKSSLFEAFYWCLYGNTSRGVRGDAVENWNGEERCLVIAELDVAAGHMAVLRARNPNTLEISLNGGVVRPVEQIELDSILGMAADVFLYSIYSAQFTPAFVDLRPAEQMAVYSSVLGLDVWEAAGDQASLQSRTVMEKLEVTRREQANLEGQAKQLLTVSYDKEEQAWERERSEKVQQHNSDLKTSQSVLTAVQKELKMVEVGAIKFRELRDKVQTQALEVTKWDRQARGLEQEIAKLKSRNYKNCPTCGAPVSDAHVKRELVKKRAEFVGVEGKATGAMLLHDQLMKEMVQYRDFEVKMLEIQRRLGAAEERLTALRQALTTTTAQTNPYTRQKKEQAQQAAALGASLAMKEKQIQALEQELGAAQFWVKEFKELRLALITESLDQLTLESNEALFSLGLKDWGLKFDTESVTKKGTVNRNFTILVQASNLNKPVPWEAWSGGESQRLRLATRIGFGNLICSRVSVQPTVEFYDEPTQWLSSTGVESLLSILNERAKRYRKVILLADHRSFAFGEFAGTIEVTKDKNGSKIKI